MYTVKKGGERMEIKYLKINGKIYQINIKIDVTEELLRYQEKMVKESLGIISKDRDKGIKLFDALFNLMSELEVSLREFADILFVYACDLVQMEIEGALEMRNDIITFLDERTKEKEIEKIVLRYIFLSLI
ncbi:MAG: hypothetical protein ABDI07_10635, partial [Candidatus Kryptonium sp.]